MDNNYYSDDDEMMNIRNKSKPYQMSRFSNNHDYDYRNGWTYTTPSFQYRAPLSSQQQSQQSSLLSVSSLSSLSRQPESSSLTSLQLQTTAPATVEEEKEERCGRIKTPLPLSPISCYDDDDDADDDNIDGDGYQLQPPLPSVPPPPPPPLPHSPPPLPPSPRPAATSATSTTTTTATKRPESLVLKTASNAVSAAASSISVASNAVQSLRRNASQQEQYQQQQQQQQQQYQYQYNMFNQQFDKFGYYMNVMDQKIDQSNSNFVNHISNLNIKLNHILAEQKEIQQQLQTNWNLFQQHSSNVVADYNGMYYSLTNYKVNNIKYMIGRNGCYLEEYQKLYGVVAHIPPYQLQLQNYPIFIYCLSSDPNKVRNYHAIVQRIRNILNT